ncbi:MAG: ribulose-phosphate 3-epimerase [Chloroflexi bacterium HGW-Chloroflexi-10]|nr:MAG: ribulose-phosphate 3-epimerase [Chloroflexi bacterium HGW-Chloroflexi-10]
MIISASIISSNFLEFGQQISDTKKAGVDWLHIDVMDGSFVPNITVGPFILEYCRKIVDLPLDVHLMIVEPEKHIQTFAKIGANRLSIHIENNPNALRTIQQIRELGVSPSIVINPSTPPEAVEYLLPFVDMVLIMTVNPGYSGQNFIPEMRKKIVRMKELINQINPAILLQVDGGINSENIVSVTKAGADVIVAATAIYKHEKGIAAGVTALRNP